MDDRPNSLGDEADASVDLPLKPRKRQGLWAKPTVRRIIPFAIGIGIIPFVAPRPVGGVWSPWLAVLAAGALVSALLALAIVFARRWKSERDARWIAEQAKRD